MATATGTYGAETVTLPALTTGAVGNFNGVVFADSPSAFAAGQLTALDSYESTVRGAPDRRLHVPVAGPRADRRHGGALDGTTGGT